MLEQRLSRRPQGYTNLTIDFDTNKRIIEEIAVIPSKLLRNKIAGFITHLMKRLQCSTVRGFEVDSETKDMLKMMDFQSIPGLQLASSRGAGANFRT